MVFLMMSIFAALAVLIICFVCYACLTNSVIKDQEKQIARLKRDNMRLKSLCHKKSREKIAQIIEIHDSRVDEANIPEFNNI